MEAEFIELKKYLKKELQTRQSLNRSYSTRAFSRDLGISPTSLSSFLRGERKFSMENVNKIFKYLRKRPGVHCSWCDSRQKDVKLLIGGPRDQFICYDCIQKCNEIIDTKKERKR